MKLEWKVYRYDINKKEIVVFNIFDHGGFNDAVREALCTAEDKDEFEGVLRRELFYYFGCKSEYEILITDIHNVDVYHKLDIFDQVWNNRDAFVEYVWRNKRYES